MSKFIGIKKTENKSIYILSKDNDFLKQMTDVLIRLGLHEQIPEDFPCNLSNEEEVINLDEKNDFYHSIEGDTYDINIIYANKKIFVICNSDKESIETFNDIMNSYFLES